MKWVLYILLSISILYPAWVNTMLLVNYEINKDYCIQTLCENKDKPEMHCEGSCQFSKQLRAADAHDAQKEVQYISAQWPLFPPSAALELSILEAFTIHEYFYLLSSTEGVHELLTPPPQFS